jgi:hypothetical protein
MTPKQLFVTFYEQIGRAYLINRPSFISALFKAAGSTHDIAINTRIFADSDYRYKICNGTKPISIDLKRSFPENGVDVDGLASYFASCLENNADKHCSALMRKFGIVDDSYDVDALSKAIALQFKEFIDEKDKEDVADIIAVSYLELTSGTPKMSPKSINEVENKDCVPIPEITDDDNGNKFSPIYAIKKSIEDALSGKQIIPLLMPRLMATAHPNSTITLLDALTSINNLGKSSIVLIVGEGGIGKSYIILDSCKRLLDDSASLPIYVPMKQCINNNKFPISDWMYSQGILRETDRDGFADKLTISRKRIVLFLDGINEYLIRMTSKDGSTDLFNEIRKFQRLGNITIVISSRSAHGFDDFYDVSFYNVKRIEHKQVREFLSEVNIDSIPMEAKLIDLLTLPIVLDLFVKTYSKDAMSSMNKVTTHAELLNECVSLQMGRITQTPLVKYAVNLFLPKLGQKSRQISLRPNEMKHIAFEIVRETLSDEYSDALFAIDTEYSVIEELSANENKCFDRLVNDILIGNALYLLRDGRSISWQHELFLDWFWAKAIADNSEYGNSIMFRESLRELCDLMSEKIVAGTIEDYLPVALFVYELTVDMPGMELSIEYITLLCRIAEGYFNLSDYDNRYKYASAALGLLDKLPTNRGETSEIAKLLNKCGYYLLNSVRPQMDEDERKNRIFTAKNHIEQALIILEKLSDFAADENQIIYAQTLGNLGACNLQIGRYYNKSAFNTALEIHTEAYKRRTKVFDNNPSYQNKDYLLGRSYICFGTDHFHLGMSEPNNSEARKLHLIQSLDNHKEGFEYMQNCPLRHNDAMYSAVGYLGSLAEMVKQNFEVTDEQMVIGCKMITALLAPTDGKIRKSREQALGRNMRWLKNIETHVICIGTYLNLPQNVKRITVKELYLKATHELVCLYGKLSIDNTNLITTFDT